MKLTKRILCLAMAAVMLFALCACGDKGSDATKTKPSDSVPADTSSGPKAPAEAEDVAIAFMRAHYTRDYATRFTMTFYDSRQQWEDERIAETGSAEEFFAMAQEQADAKGIEATVDSFDSYYRCYHEVYVASILDIYGPYTLSVTIAENVRMDDARWEQVRNNLLGAIDEKYIDGEAFGAIPEAYELTVNVNVDGEKNDFSENYLVYMVYHDGQWLVASHSA